VLGEDAGAGGLLEEISGVLAEIDEVAEEDPAVLVELIEVALEDRAGGGDLEGELFGALLELAEVAAQALAGLRAEAGEALVAGDVADLLGGGVGGDSGVIGALPGAAELAA
jgi:hypothetical protein